MDRANEQHECRALKVHPETSDLMSWLFSDSRIRLPKIKIPSSFTHPHGDLYADMHPNADIFNTTDVVKI